MSREDFQNRIGRLVDESASTAPMRARQRPKRAVGPIAVVFYGLWGLAFGTALAFLASNYDQMVADAQAQPDGPVESLLMGLAAFLLITLGLMGLSALIAFVRLVFRRPSAPNWYRIAVFGLGMSVSSLALGMAGT